MAHVSFGQWLKQRRKALDLTQEEFARLVGCAGETLRKIEADRLRPSKQIVGCLAQQLSIAPEEHDAFMRFARAEPGTQGQGAASDGVPPWHAGELGPSNLPPQRTSFVGRERELRAACALLRRADIRLLTLTGPGGMGKTRLALHVAAELRATFAQGVFLVELAPLQDPSLLASTIAQTLGVKETGTQAPIESLRMFVRDKCMLLVLDNFEHLLTGSSIVTELLAAAPQMKALVTSRALLRVAGEHEFPVPPLAIPDAGRLPLLPDLAAVPAVALLIARAQAGAPTFALTAANAASVREICVRLEGWPLAIELGAARLRMLSPAALLQRLSMRLDLLSTGKQDVPARHQSLRAVIAWSYELLDQTEQALFRRLAVFVGGCTIDAIEAICAQLSSEPEASGQAPTPFSMLNSPFSILNGLEALLDNNLVWCEQRADEDPRFMMLETIRAYALEQLEALGEVEALRRQHAAYYLALAETAEPQLMGAEQIAWLERLEREHGNLRTALQWALDREERTIAGRLGGALWRFWYIRGYLTEGRQWLNAVVAAGGALEPSIRAKVLNGAGNLAYLQSDFHAAAALHEQCLQLKRELGDKGGVAGSLSNVAMVRAEQGHFRQARGYLEESLLLRRELEDTWGCATALLNLGQIICAQGDYERANSLLAESLELQRALGDTWGVAMVLHSLGEVALAQGDDPRAAQFWEQSLSLFKALEDKWGSALTLIRLGETALYCGDYTQAIVLAEEGMALCREIDNKAGVAFALTILGSVAFDRGDFVQSASLLQGSLELGRACTRNIDVVRNLEMLAHVAGAQGQARRAARLYGAAELARTTMEAPPPTHHIARYARGVADARALVDDAAWAGAWAEGQVLTIDQAVAYALEDENH